MRHRHTYRGQASVEAVAIALVVAVLLGAVTAWLVIGVRDVAPPVGIDRVWAPVDQLPVPDDRPPDLGLAPRERSGPSLATRIRRTVGRAGRVVRDGASAFAGGFVGGTRQAFVDFMDDPVGSLVGAGGVLGELTSDPLGFTLAQVRAIEIYASELAAMPAGEAYRRFMRDLGSATADVVIARGKAAVGKAVLRAVRRRFDDAGPGVPTPEQRDTD